MRRPHPVFLHLIQSDDVLNWANKWKHFVKHVLQMKEIAKLIK
jgi:hypothetical protein